MSFIQQALEWVDLDKIDWRLFRRKVINIIGRQLMIAFSLWAYYNKMDYRDFETLKTTLVTDVTLTFFPRRVERDSEG